MKLKEYKAPDTSTLEGKIATVIFIVFFVGMTAFLNWISCPLSIDCIGIGRVHSPYRDAIMHLRFK